jgi:hypothetical protein
LPKEANSVQTERRADRTGEDDGASNRANARREHLIIELFSFSDHEGELLGFDGIGGETSTDSIERAVSSGNLLPSVD